MAKDEQTITMTPAPVYRYMTVGVSDDGAITIHRGDVTVLEVRTVAGALNKYAIDRMAEASRRERGLLPKEETDQELS